jgi:hypothetical protein
MHEALYTVVDAIAVTKCQRKEPEQQERQHSRNASNSRNTVTAEIPKNAVGTTFKEGPLATSGVCEQKNVRLAVEKTAKTSIKQR